MKTRLLAPFALILALGLGFVHAAEDKKLEVGDKAPAFSATDSDGRTWKLSELLPEKSVLLYFFPKSDTPGCTRQACGLRDQMADLQNNKVQVIGVSFDDASIHRVFKKKYNLSFPLIPDRDGLLADLYQARQGPGARVARRVTYLIGKDGRIQHITDTRDSGVHLTEMRQKIDETSGGSATQKEKAVGDAPPVPPQ